MGNRRVVERWVAALAADDLAAQRELLHPDFVGRYPQSGEVIRGPDNRMAIAENYPDRERVGWGIQVDAITGTDDAFVTTPAAFAWSVVHLSGTEDEFTITGTLKDYVVTDSLSDVKVPTLLTVGEFDEVGPKLVQGFAERIPGARFEQLAGAAHMTTWDAPDAMIAAVRSFLRSADSVAVKASQ